MCSLSGEDLAEDESIRLKIRELSKEIERLESDPVEALKKAESKLELMENIRDRVILRFLHYLFTSKVYFSDSRSAFLIHSRDVFLGYFHLYFIVRFPHHLLTCYKLAKLVNCSKQMTKFRVKVLKQTLTLGYNYHRYYTDLMD